MSEAYDAAMEIKTALAGIEESLDAIHEDMNWPELRDWFAMHAMSLAPNMVNTQNILSHEEFAAACYRIADAMIAQRSNP